MRANADRPGDRTDAPASVDTGKLSLESAAAGALGLCAMTVVVRAAPLVGARAVDLSRFYGYAAAGNYSFEDRSAPLVGWALYAAIGVVAALCYGWLVERRQPRAPALTGALFGLIPWLLFELVFCPLVGLGPFAMRASGTGGHVLVALAGHLAYGAVMGAFLRVLVRSSAIPTLVVRRAT